jgi:hypothetical protein
VLCPVKYGETYSNFQVDIRTRVDGEKPGQP